MTATPKRQCRTFTGTIVWNRKTGKIEGADLCRYCGKTKAEHQSRAGQGDGGRKET